MAQFKERPFSLNLNEKNKFISANKARLPPKAKSFPLVTQEPEEQRLPLGFGPKLDQSSTRPLCKTPNTCPPGENSTMALLREIKNPQGAGILVDVGHSCTHVIPVFDNQVISSSVRRAEVGGKLVSKFLMESVSLTQFDLSRHFFLVTDLKEKCCEILASPGEFLDARHRPSLGRLSRVFYALNDYEIRKRGGVVSNPSPEQLKIAKNLQNLVTLQLERVIFPEILFQPSL